MKSKESSARRVGPRFPRGFLECLEERKLLTLQPISMADPGLYGDSPNGSSSAPSFSADGNLVAFSSLASNVAAGDTNGFVSDIFVRNVATGQNVLVSENAAGTGSGDDQSTLPRINASGRYVVFQSTATNLVSGDTNGAGDVYVRDLLTSTTTLVSRNVLGTGTGNGGSGDATISADGRYVAFSSNATNLVANDTNGAIDVFVRDVVAGTTTLVSATNSGLVGDTNSFLPTIAADGQHVVFISLARNLTAAADTNNGYDVFVRNLLTSTTTLVTVNTGGVNSGNSSASGTASISANGRFVTFSSSATDLVANDTNGQQDVFVRDLQAGTTSLVSASTSGGFGNGSSNNESISADGTHVVFLSTAGNLAANDPNSTFDVFSRDLVAGTTTLLTRNQAGIAVGGAQATPRVSGNGRYVWFVSNSNGIVANDSNGLSDEFLYDLQTGVVRCLTANLSGVPTGKSTTSDYAFSGDSNRIAFASSATDLVTGDNNRQQDLFFFDITAGQTTLASTRSTALPAAFTGNKDSGQPMISADGRYIAYETTANNLVPLDGGALFDVIRYDTTTGTSQLVSINRTGTSSGGDSSFNPAISADGRYIAFESRATSLVSQTDTNSTTDIFVRDMDTGTTSLVSVNSAGTGTGNNFSDNSDISANGRYVVYTSRATNLIGGYVKGANNDGGDLFVRDVQLGTTSLVSANTAGNGADRRSEGGQISADGRFVVFASYATDLVPAFVDVNGIFSRDVYVRDLATGTTTLVSRSTASASNGGNVDSRYPTISANGRFVAFESDASDLVPNDTNGRPDVFVRDLVTGTIVLASVSLTGGSGNNSSTLSSTISTRLLSDDGRYVLFQSSARDLVVNDGSSVNDIFVRDLVGGTTTLVSVNAAGTAGGNKLSASYFAISGNGQVVAFASQATDLVTGFIPNNPQVTHYNVYYRDLAAHTTILASQSHPNLLIGGNMDSPRAYPPALSSDGQVLAFSGRAALTDTDSNDLDDVYVFRPDQIVVGPTDLAVSDVTAPGSLALGETILVNWKVSNVGDIDAVGAWQDAIYLSPTPTLGLQSQLLTTIPHVGGLAGGAAYTAAAEVTVSGVIPATYYVIVQSDRRNQVVETEEVVNNFAATSGGTAVFVPQLTLGAPIAGGFTLQANQRYYQVHVPAGTSLEVTLSSLAADGATAIYISRNELPSPWPSDFHVQSSTPHAELVVPLTEEGTYFILVEGRSGGAANSAFTLVAREPQFAVDNVSPSQGASAGWVTTLIRGAHLTGLNEVQLVRDGVVIPAVELTPGDSTYFYATFDLTGQDTGAYDVVVTNEGGAVATLSDGFEIVAGERGTIRTELVLPATVRLSRVFSFTVLWTNDGLTDVPAPLLRVVSSVPFGFSPSDTSSAGTMHTFLGLGSTGPAGTIRPGQTERITLYSFAEQTPNLAPYFVDVENVFEDPNAAFDYESYRPFLTPGDMTDEAFSPIFAQFVSQVGPTNRDYLAMLGRNAELLPPELGDNRFEGDLLDLEVRKAQATIGNSISGRVFSPTSIAKIAGIGITARNLDDGASFNTVTLNDGSFLFEDVAPGTYELRLRDNKAQGLTTEVTVDAGESLTDVMVNLEAGATLMGQVTAAATGSAVPNPSILIFSELDPFGAVASDATGRFVARNLRPGNYTLMILAPGFARTLVNVVVDEGVEQLEIALAAQSTATGVVTLADGQPIEHLLVAALRPADPSYTASSVVLDEGSFQLGSLASGIYDFTIFHPGYDPVHLQTNVSAGQTINLGAIELLPSADPPVPTASAGGGNLPEVIPALTFPAPQVIAKLGLSAVWEGAYLAALGATLGHSDFIDIVNTYFVNFFGPNVVRNVDGQVFDNTQTETGLEIILHKLEMGIRSVDEVKQFIETFDPCNPEKFQQSFSLQQLQAQRQIFPDLWRTIHVDNDSLEQYKTYWWYADGITDLPSSFAGGVGEGGTPPSYAIDRIDSRDVSGSVRVTILPSGSAWLKGNFHLHVEDTFDFEPGDLGLELLTQIVVGTYKTFEILEVTNDVPFVADLNKKKIVRFSVNLKKDPHCGKPIQPLGSYDPNDIVGPGGFGPERFLTGGAPLNYTVHFENDPEHAQADAQEVVVSETLDADLDWSTFELGNLQFGSQVVVVPSGLQQFHTQVNYHNRDGSPLLVDVDAALDLQTGVVTWSFRSVDPDTGLLPDGVFAGFLPINDETGRGEGLVTYSVSPKPGLATGTALDAQASIVFDTNDPLETNSFTNTIDSGSPQTSVTALPSVTNSSSFLVGWSGADDVGGSGIATFDVFVSDNGGPFQPFVIDTSDLTATFAGQPGHTYRFYSTATDNVGNKESKPATAEATTLVQSLTQTSVTSNHAPSSVYGEMLLFTATVSANLSSAGIPAGFVQFQIDGFDFGVPVTLNNGVATIAAGALNATGHSIVAHYTSGDNRFDGSSGNLTQVVSPATLTVNVLSETRLYGASNPAWSFQISGFMNNDTAASLVAFPTLTTVATVLSHVGDYPITASGALAVNYVFAYASGTLHVTPAPLKINADNKAKLYGAALPVLTASFSGFVNGDTPATLTTQPTLTTTATAASHGGSFPITVGAATSADYIITYVPGTLLVNPAPLTIVADAKSKIVGAANPELTYTANGLTNGDTKASLTMQPILATTATTASPVGNYPISASGAASTDYTISYVSGTLAVTAAIGSTTTTLTSSANPSVYGQAVTFAVVVTSSGEVPVGNVAFRDGATVLATVALVDGKAYYTTSNLSRGNHSISAKYAGSTRFAGSTSPTLGQAVQTANFQPDPILPGKLALVIGGTDGDDQILVNKASKSGKVQIVVDESNRDKYQFNSTFEVTSSTRIIVYGAAGNDTIIVAGNLDLPTLLDGGPGNDRLQGGNGANILLGGPGNDWLFASGGRDLLFGGLGADSLQGKTGETLQVGGTTNYDNQPAALCRIMQEWSRTDLDIDRRLDHILNGNGWNGSAVLNRSTVQDDRAIDSFYGASGLDAIFFSIGDLFCGKKKTTRLLSI